MAELRKPDLVILLRIQGKRKAQKIEAFDFRKWEKDYSCKGKKYRIRVNGRWFKLKKEASRNKKDYLTQYELRDLLWRSIKYRF